MRSLVMTFVSMKEQRSLAAAKMAPSKKVSKLIYFLNSLCRCENELSGNDHVNGESSLSTEMPERKYSPVRSGIIEIERG